MARQGIVAQPVPRHKSVDLPVPPGAIGFSEFGKTMGWGTGDAEARARMETLTREELENKGGYKRDGRKMAGFL